MSNPHETVAERIEAVRRMTPPPEGRNARKGYASKDDFAVVLGAGRSTVYNWMRRENPSYPEEEYREKLAGLSGGLYSPEDFLDPMDRGQAGLSGAVARNTASIEALREAVSLLLQSVVALGGKVPEIPADALPPKAQDNGS